MLVTDCSNPGGPLAVEQYSDVGVAKDADDRDVHFGYYAVGFYDLLAQQSSLEELRSLPTDAGATDRFVQAAKRTAGTVASFRRLVRDYVQSFSRTPDISQIPEWAVTGAFAQYKRFRDVQLQVQCFADTTLLYYAFPEGEPTYGMRSLLGLVLGMGVSHLSALAAGVPGRGSIEVDIGCDILPGEVYGPVLSRAYRLENKIAKHPRVVVGQGAADFCGAMCARSGTSGEDQIARQMANALQAMLLRESDGTTIVHYLGPHFMEVARETAPQETADLVSKAHTFVIAEADRFRNDEELGPRYRELESYFRAYAPAWRGLLTKE